MYRWNAARNFAAVEAVDNVGPSARTLCDSTSAMPLSSVCHAPRRNLSSMELLFRMADRLALRVEPHIFPIDHPAGYMDAGPHGYKDHYGARR